MPFGNTASALSIDPNYYYQESCKQLMTKDLRTYGPGSRGAFVTALQQFLSIEGTYQYGMGPMTWAEFTDYYGTATTAAVQDWQAKNGVVSSGSVYTTGYGYVGPKTRAAIAQRCGEKLDTNQLLPNYPSPYSGLIQANHEYEDGVHTVSGTIELLNGCYSGELEGVVVRESFPEQVTLEFTVRDTSHEDIACTQAITYEKFETSFNASAAARIDAVVNGSEANFELESNTIDNENYVNNNFAFNQLVTIDESVILFDKPDDGSDSEYPIGNYQLRINPASVDYKNDPVPTEVEISESDMVTVHSLEVGELKVIKVFVTSESFVGNTFVILVLDADHEANTSTIFVLKK